MVGERRNSKSGEDNDEPVLPPVPFLVRIGIRWRHRSVSDPTLWRDRIGFDELVAVNQWDLPPSIDELLDRTDQYYEA